MTVGGTRLLGLVNAELVLLLLSFSSLCSGSTAMADVLLERVTSPKGVTDLDSGLGVTDLEMGLGVPVRESGMGVIVLGAEVISSTSLAKFFTFSSGGG